MKGMCGVWRTWALVLMGGLALTNTGCGDDPPTVTFAPSLLGVLTDTLGASRFVQLIEQAELEDDFSGVNQSAGFLTVLLPSDSALAAAGLDSAGIALLTRTEAQRLVNYHTLGSRRPAGSFSVGALFTRLTNTEPLSFLDLTIVGPDTLLNGTSRLNPVGVEAGNGLIHNVDEVLIPPTSTLDFVFQNNADLSLFYQAVLRTSFAPLLTSGGARPTFMAPTDDAMEDEGLTADSVATAPLADLERLVAMHLSDSLLPLDSLDYVQRRPNRLSVTDTTARWELEADSTNFRYLINGGCRIVAADLQTSNGIIHKVDRVILPPQPDLARLVQPLVTITRSFSRLQLILSRLQAAGRAPAFPPQYTLLAPTDGAFDIARITPDFVNNDANLPFLDSLIQTHIITVRRYTPTFVADEFLNTLRPNTRIEIVTSIDFEVLSIQSSDDTEVGLSLTNNLVSERPSNLNGGIYVVHPIPNVILITPVP